MPAKKTTKPEAAPAKPAKAAPKAKAETKAEPKGKAAKAAPAAKGKAAKAAPPVPARKPITQAELIDRLASKSGATKTHVKAVLDELAAVAAGEVAVGFTIPGIGKVGVRETAERQGRNPATGAAITIPAGKRVKFSVAAALKKAVG
ncbi:MAG: HU family DNA-binding protein [Blastocatellia bacterium]|nr:HU family DNA-binding protein [Blastocatellia bacterium]